MTTAAVLALFAAALAWPIPRWLASSRWPARAPRAAIVLWQAIGLSGGLCAVLAAVSFTLAPLGRTFPRAFAVHLRHLVAGHPMAGLGPLNVAGLAIATALLTRLLTVLALSTRRTLRERRRHRHLVDLAGTPHTEHTHLSPAAPGPVPVSVDLADGCGLCESGLRMSAGRLRVLNHPVAVAYCVPGVRRPRVVVSAGLLSTLGAGELDAVLRHEEAHARGRHDLVIQPFVAWQATFPFLRPAREATAAVSLLVEMLADDAAARHCGGRTLARALARLGVAMPVPAGAFGITGLGPHGLRPSTLRLSTLRPRALPDGTATTAAQPWAVPGPPRTVPGSTMAADGAPHISPVVARIARLIEPPKALRWWQRGPVYLLAVAVLAVPALTLLLP